MDADAMERAVGLVDRGRALLALEGPDARAVLQGVVTNDVARLAPERAVYAALLTPQGKYLFDFFLIDDGPERVLIDVPADRVEALAARLGMYCLRRKATVARAEGEVGLAWGAGVGPIRGARVLADPRHPELGLRLYAPDAWAALAAAGIGPATAADRDRLRVRLGVPESGIELVPDDTYILEAGFEALNGVDFRKGCYVGQEVTARMKHKTELRKRLVRVRVEGEAPPGTEILADGRAAGTLFTQAGGFGLAHLRLDRAEGALAAGAARIAYES